MVIGIQTNSRLPLPGQGDPVGTSGRSPSESSHDPASGLEPVEIQPSAPTADQTVIVQLNFSGARALSRARLAGDRTGSDPNIFSQSPAAPNVQPEPPPAAGAGALRADAWIPQSLAAKTSAGGLSQALTPAVLNNAFIRATADLAASMLAAGPSRPARVVPLAAAPGKKAEAADKANTGMD